MAEEREANDDGRERPRSAADRRSSRSGSGSSESGSSSSGGTAPKGRATAVRDTKPAKVSPVARLVRFLREVVAELRKVIWPSRQQLITYTIVVLVFVSFMVALVAGLDFVFGQGVLFLFGN